jgi:hypothetical protein
MLRKILAGVLVALAAVGAAGNAEACEERIAQPAGVPFEGKLVKVLEEDCPPECAGTQPHAPRLRVVWVLKTAKRKYELKLGSRTLTRLAAKLEGRDVTVTGTPDGGVIDVRAIEATGIDVWELQSRDFVVE